MPKVTAEYREARRDEIAHAAMRCLARNGFANTSMADIIAEAEVSAGAIYSHFTGKADIARHVAGIVMDSNEAELTAFAAGHGDALSPAEIIGFVLERMTRSGVETSLLLQIWAEATVDDELHGMLQETVGRLRRAYVLALRPWLADNGLADDDLALRRVVTTMLTLSQGFIVHTALFGGSDPREYLATAGMLLR